MTAHRKPLVSRLTSAGAVLVSAAVLIAIVNLVFGVPLIIAIAFAVCCLSGGIVIAGLAAFVYDRRAIRSHRSDDDVLDMDDWEDRLHHAVQRWLSENRRNESEPADDEPVDEARRETQP